ncbi:MAG: hypothetical protein KKC05_01365, partial [Nanoarchaeota archaeon]|nr:hypothetical protein [Nanoarchaeota archaeon]
ARTNHKSSGARNLARSTGYDSSSMPAFLKSLRRVSSEFLSMPKHLWKKRISKLRQIKPSKMIIHNPLKDIVSRYGRNK